MEGEALGENRHVFGEDGVVNRRWEFGLASPLSRTLELIGAVKQRTHRARPRLLFELFGSLGLA